MLKRLWRAFNRIVLRRAPAPCYACRGWRWRGLPWKDPVYWICDDCIRIYLETNRR
jgi:hypothetical protein